MPVLVARDTLKVGFQPWAPKDPTGEPAYFAGKAVIVVIETVRKL
jgi:hypothetical protein